MASLTLPVELSTQSKESLKLGMSLIDSDLPGIQSNGIQSAIFLCIFSRYIHPDGVIRYYDMKEAQGAKILQQLAKGIYAAEDTYMLHEFTIAQKEVFLLTNKRLLYLTYNNGQFELMLPSRAL